jgi:hypothetical protein
MKSRRMFVVETAAHMEYVRKANRIVVDSVLETSSVTGEAR